LQHYRFGLRWL